MFKYIFWKHEHTKKNKHCEYLLVHEKTELSVGKFENSSEFFVLQ